MKKKKKENTTNELLGILSSVSTTSQLEKYTRLLSKPSTSFAEYINEKIAESQISPAALIHASQIQRNYGYQILNGTRRPSRDKVIALCLSLNLSLSEVQKALNLAPEGQLYPKIRRDSILIFSVQKRLSVLETNEILLEMGETPLK